MSPRPPHPLPPGGAKRSWGVRGKRSPALFHCFNLERNFVSGVLPADYRSHAPGWAFAPVRIKFRLPAHGASCRKLDVLLADSGRRQLLPRDCPEVEICRANLVGPELFAESPCGSLQIRRSRGQGKGKRRQELRRDLAQSGPLSIGLSLRQYLARFRATRSGYWQ